MNHLVVALGCSALLAAGGLAHAEASDVGKLPPAAGVAIDFARDIRPILAGRCVSCHGADKQKGGLRLDHGKAVGEGGNGGTVLVPGKSAASRLILMVAGLDRDARMPPSGKPLTRVLHLP